MEDREWRDEDRAHVYDKILEGLEYNETVGIPVDTAEDVFGGLLSAIYHLLKEGFYVGYGNVGSKEDPREVLLVTGIVEGGQSVYVYGEPASDET